MVRKIRVFAMVALVAMLGACGEISFGNINFGGENTENESGSENEGGTENEGGGTTTPDTPSYPAQNGSGETGGYSLVWQDLFDGTHLDESVWNIEVNGNGGGNNELQYYRRENVGISKEPQSGRSCLTLTARRESYLGKPFTSGRVNTMGKKFFTHGKVEAYILLPKTANGLWPAYWMMGNDFQSVGWPRCGEIDILEMGNAQGIASGTQETYFNGACHWGYYKNGGYPNYARHSNAPYSLQDGEFHLYTLVWDETMIRMYLDLDKNPNATPYYEMGVTEKGDDWGTGYYFHHDFFILFNLAVGGNFTNIWNDAAITALPTNGSEAKMYIDFVKVYQK